MAKKTEAEQGTIQEKEGTNKYGFQDPTSEFPREDYWGESSINRAARGAGGVGQKDKPNDLKMSAVFPKIDMGLGTVTETVDEDGNPKIDFESNTGRSKYPFNKVTETHSGHVIEIDDTEGNERILIKHTTGSGIEMRKDGSIWISAAESKYETVGANCKIVVEGDTEIAYEGNLDMYVGGSFNLDVGGNHNTNIKGQRKTRIGKDDRTTTSGNHEYITKKNSSIATMGNGTDTVLGDFRKTITKGKHDIMSEGSIEVAADGTLIMSGKSEAVMVGKACNISGMTVSAIGMKGTFGGDLVDFVGKTYSGPLGPTPLSGAAFYGGFIGTATGAITANTAMMATVAGSAASLGAGGFGVPPLPSKPLPTLPSAPPPNSAIVGLHLAGGSYAIRSVTIDGGGTLKSKILDLDGYGGIFDNGEPTTEEIRQAVRDHTNKDVLGGQAAIDGIINTEFDVGTPPAIGRTAGVGRTTTFGTTPLGNSEKGLGKQFTVTKLEESVEKEIQNAIVDSGILGDSDGA